MVQGTLKQREKPEVGSHLNYSKRQHDIFLHNMLEKK